MTADLSRHFVAQARHQAINNPRPELVKWAQQMPPGVLIPITSPLGQTRMYHATRDRIARRGA